MTRSHFPTPFLSLFRPPLTQAYDATRFQPHVYFDHWSTMLERIPSKYIVSCSEMVCEEPFLSDRLTT